MKTRTERTSMGQILEIGFENGKKVLNSKNSNYSFGSLHKVFQKALTFYQIEKHFPQNVLLLGLGGGSVIDILRNELMIESPITALEIDNDLIKTVLTEFGLDKYGGLEIVHCDATEWVRNRTTISKFDLIVDDLFIDTMPVASSLDRPYLEGIRDSLSPGGKYLKNLMGLSEKEMMSFSRTAGEVFGNYEELLLKRFGNRVVLCTINP